MSLADFLRLETIQAVEGRQAIHSLQLQDRVCPSPTGSPGSTSHRPGGRWASRCSSSLSGSRVYRTSGSASSFRPTTRRSRSGRSFATSKPWLSSTKSWSSTTTPIGGTSEEVAGTSAIEIHEPVQGYGAAIRRGLAEATGDLMLVCEPDDTFLAGDSRKFLAYSDDVDIVYGSRTVKRSSGSAPTWGDS